MPLDNIFNRRKGDKGDKGKKKLENAGDQRWLQEQQSGKQESLGAYEFLKQKELEEAEQKLERMRGQYDKLSKNEKRGNKGIELQSKIARYNEKKEMIEQKLSEIRQPTTFEGGAASTQGYDRQLGYGGVSGHDMPVPFYGPQGMSSEMSMNLVPPQGDVNAQQYSNQRDRGNLVSLVTMDSNIPRNLDVSPVTTDYQPGWSIQGGQGDANAQQHNPQEHKKVESNNEGYDATQFQYNVTNPMHRFPARRDMRQRNAQARPLDNTQQHEQVQLSAYIAHAGELAREGRPRGVERRAILGTGDELAGINRDQQQAWIKEWWSGGQPAPGGGERSVQAPTRIEVEKNQKEEMRLMEQKHTAAQDKLTNEYNAEIARLDAWGESDPVAYPVAYVEAWKQAAYQDFNNKWNDLVNQQAEEKRALEQRHQARINLEWGGSGTRG